MRIQMSPRILARGLISVHGRVIVRTHLAVSNSIGCHLTDCWSLDCCSQLGCTVVRRSRCNIFIHPTSLPAQVGELSPKRSMTSRPLREPLNTESFWICRGVEVETRPSRLGLGRVSVVRGQGPLSGQACIDDYIRATEPVFDYLTKWSGLVRARCFNASL